MNSFKKNIHQNINGFQKAAINRYKKWTYLTPEKL